MTIEAMNKYLVDRGFIVTRRYIPARQEYCFELSKNGVKKQYYWKYDRTVDNFTKYQKESMDRMVADFDTTKALDLAIKAADTSLFGSIETGYVYVPDPDPIYLFIDAEKMDELIKTPRKDYTKYCKCDVKEIIHMARIPELNNRTLKIKDVIFNNPATIVFWSDGTKTVVKSQNDEVYDPEKGLAMAVSKKMFGNHGNYYNNFRPWLDSYYKKQEVPDSTMIDGFECYIKSVGPDGSKIITEKIVHDITNLKTNPGSDNN